MDKVGWKVVRNMGDGEYRSAVLFMDSAWSVSYPPAVRVESPQDTPLLAFDSRDRAREFANIHYAAYLPTCIFKARLENPRPVREVVWSWETRLFRRFWAKPFGGRAKTVCAAPPGTLACDAITLLEPA